jgi:hypothetical protein
VVLNGTPEMFTDIYSTKSNRCTCIRSRIKCIRILCHYLSPNFTYAFPQTTQFCVWTALICLGIATGDWLLWTGYWNVRVS